MVNEKCSQNYSLSYKTICNLVFFFSLWQHPEGEEEEEDEEECEEEEEESDTNDDPDTDMMDERDSNDDASTCEHLFILTFS